MTYSRRAMSAYALMLWAVPGLVRAQQPGPPRPTTEATAAAPSWTRITYISGTTIYLEVGSRAGLTETSILDVVRIGTVIARLKVSALSSNRAACEVASQTVDVVVGDSVRYVATSPAAAVAATPATPASTGATSGTTARRHYGVRGRLGLRYLVVAPAGGAGGGLRQPAYDLRLDGRNVAGTKFGVTADFRAQRTNYAASGAQPARSPLNVTRVYQAALSWAEATSGTRVTLGRQFASALSTVGLYDGLGVDVDRQRWSAGGFLGSQPDAASFGTSGRVREYGLYGQWHTRIGTPNPMSFTVGGVGSYVGNEVDREYTFARFMSNSRMLSVYATQEIDFNRGWKRATEHTATTPTAVFASVQFTPVPAFSVSGGLDNRRSVRLYRDYLSPEIAFDDSFRQGTWLGLSVSTPRHARFGLDRRESHGGSSGDAVSTTALASLSGISPFHIGLRARGTLYTGVVSTGQLVSGSFEIDPWNTLRLEASGGARTTHSTLSGASSPRLTWMGLDADVGIGRSVYLLLSAYREREVGGIGSIQSYASLSWRF